LESESAMPHQREKGRHDTIIPQHAYISKTWKIVLPLWLALLGLSWSPGSHLHTTVQDRCVPTGCRPEESNDCNWLAL